MSKSARIRRTLIGLLLALVAAAPFASTLAAGEVVFAVNREADMLDLHVGSSRYDLVPAAQLYDTYLFLTPSGEFLPWLAESVTANADATEYTIVIRPGVTFHDGTPLDAAAAKYNFDRIVDPATASRAAVGDMGSYTGSEVVDERTLVVRFARLYPAFFYSLADWRAGGPHSPTAIAKDPAAYRFAPVGTGPFRFQSWTVGDRIVLERNPDYAWPRPDLTETGPARLDTVVFRTIAQADSRVVALRNGEIDGLLTLPPQELAAIAADARFQVLSATLPGSGVLIIINGGKLPTSDLAFRQALLHVASPEQIADVGYFNAWPAHRGSVLSAPNPGFLDVAGAYPFDLEAAAALLDGAGWVPGNDGVRVKDGVRAELTYIGFPSGETTRTLELMQALLDTIGVKITIKELDAGAIQAARQAGEHHIAHLTFIYKDPGFLRTLFHSENIGRGWNFTHRPDAALDALLESIQTTADATARQALVDQAQQYMIDQALVIPTVYQQQITVYSARLDGVETFPVYGESPYFYLTTKD